VKHPPLRVFQKSKSLAAAARMDCFRDAFQQRDVDFEKNPRHACGDAGCFPKANISPVFLSQQAPHKRFSDLDVFRFEIE
jgi:hypothetical protein